MSAPHARPVAGLVRLPSPTCDLAYDVARLSILSQALNRKLHRAQRLRSSPGAAGSAAVQLAPVSAFLSRAKSTL